MPEQRLARTRGECRCPEGVCLYRSGNQPGYCRREVTTSRTHTSTKLLDAAARLERMAERAEKGASWESAAHLRNWLLTAMRSLSADLTTTAAELDAAARRAIPPGDY